MKSAVAILAVSCVAACFALPVDTGVSTDLIKDDLNSWKSDFLLGGQKVQIGVGWKKDGTVAVGGKIDADIDGQVIPLSAAVSTNVKDTSKIQYEVGTRLFDRVAAIVYGSTKGALKYLLTASTPIPVSEASRQTAVGVSVEGEHMKVKTVTAGVSYGQEVVQAVVGIDDDFKPNSVNVQFGGNPYEITH